MSINFPRSSILHAEKPGSRYELSAEKMKGCLNGIFTGEKLKEKRYFVQNSKAVKYAEQVANCNDKAFFVGYSTQGWCILEWSRRITKILISLNTT